MTEASTNPPAGRGTGVRPGRHNGWLLALGIVWIVCGVLAILLPFAAALAANVLIGVLLAVGGIVQVVQAIAGAEGGGRLWQGLIGLLAAIAGFVLLAFPLTGIVTLTLVLALFFIVAGVSRAVLAWQARAVAGWGWLMFSGLLGIAVGVLIWLGLPGSAVWALGLIAGVELLFAGWAQVMVALGDRRDTRR
jgi:uncharacterized membrane protein HdeD (DUF308 family)